MGRRRQGVSRFRTGKDSLTGLFPTSALLSSAFECSLTPASLPHAQGSEPETSGSGKPEPSVLFQSKAWWEKEVGTNGQSERFKVVVNGSDPCCLFLLSSKVMGN